MTVAQARQNNVWMSALKGTISVPAIVQFVHLWLAIQNAPPLSAEPDVFRWSRTANGLYSASSAYSTYFLGSVQASYTKLLWKSWAPLKEKISWLALKNRCWTGDRLSRRRWKGRRAVCFVTRGPKPSITLWFSVQQQDTYGLNF
jgi:hypothetical protein